MCEQVVEKEILQGEMDWEDLILLENMDDSSGDTSGAAEFLDDVRQGREKRRAARLRRAMRNAGNEKEAQAQRSSSPPREPQRQRANASKASTRSVKADMTERPPTTSLTPRTSPVRVEKQTEHPPSKGRKKAEPSAGARKRKRAPSMQLVPEALRVFDGLRFFFLPNDDIRLGRKIRIQRSRNYGAIWIRDWEDPSITHVMVNYDLTYDDVLKYFKIPEYPIGRSFVNEQWMADCIHFRFLVEPDQVQYDVKGFPRDARIRARVRDPTPENSAQPAPREERLTSPPGSMARGGQSPAKAQVRSPEVESTGQTDAVRNEVVYQGSDSQPRITDDLDKAIAATQLANGIPVLLDVSDSDNIVDDASPNGSDVPLEDRANHRPAPAPNVPLWQKKFSCMQSNSFSSTSSSSSNPNALTIDILQQMCDYYERTQDHWRHTSYRKAIYALKRTPQKITCKEEALAIAGIGDRLADKIQEIVMTNRLRRLESTESDPNDEVLRLFIDVYGASYVQAQRWIAQGFRTLEDLRQKTTELTHAQRIGLEHYDDFRTRIPRDEVQAHGAHVRSVIHAIDPAITVMIGGSYRRGSPDSGDIDLLITKASAPLSELQHTVFEVAFPRMLDSGYIKANLTTPSATSTSWHGATALPPPPAPPSTSSNCPSLCRRLDIILVPLTEWGAALIYFTGNDLFNRSMRLLARKKGMRLNQRGLYKDVLRGQGGKKVTEGMLVEEGMSEERIFEVLGVPWRRPEERNC